MESSYQPLRQIPDAYITLRSADRPQATLTMIPDSLHPGAYYHAPLEPGIYTVRALRIGFHPVMDTIRLEAARIDSVMYHAVVDPVCLSSPIRAADLCTWLAR